MRPMRLMKWMVQNFWYHHIVTHIYLQLADNSESTIDCFGVVRVKRLQPAQRCVLCLRLQWPLVITAPVELVEN